MVACQCQFPSFNVRITVMWEEALLGIHQNIWNDGESCGRLILKLLRGKNENNMKKDITFGTKTGTLVHYKSIFVYISKHRKKL